MDDNDHFERSGDHFTVLQVDFGETGLWTVKYIDSQGYKTAHFIESVFKDAIDYIKEVVLSCFPAVQCHRIEWVPSPTSVYWAPQENNVDCGFYAAAVVALISMHPNDWEKRVNALITPSFITSIRTRTLLMRMALSKAISEPFKLCWEDQSPLTNSSSSVACARNFKVETEHANDTVAFRSKVDQSTLTFPGPQRSAEEKTAFLDAHFRDILSLLDSCSVSAIDTGFRGGFLRDVDTCFFSSTMNILLHCRPLQFILQALSLPELEFINQCFPIMLELGSRLNDGGGFSTPLRATFKHLQDIFPSFQARRRRLPRASGTRGHESRQSDMHECLQAVLEKALPGALSSVLFSLSMSTIATCSLYNAEYTSRTVTQTIVILTFPPHALAGHVRTLSDLFQDNFQPESLEKRCSSCSQSALGTLRYVLSISSPVLIVNLARIISQQSLQSKISERINIQLHIICGTAVYLLRSVVAHIGDSHANGHYISFIRSTPDSVHDLANTRWMRVDDSTSKVQHNLILDLHWSSVHDVVTKDGYVVVYEKLSPDTILVPSEGSPEWASQCWGRIHCANNYMTDVATHQTLPQQPLIPPPTCKAPTSASNRHHFGHFTPQRSRGWLHI